MQKSMQAVPANAWSLLLLETFRSEKGRQDIRDTEH